MIEGTGPTALYVRISDDPELSRLGVQRQERECRQLATRLGWPVGKVYEDDDRSAFKKLNRRRAYADLLADIQAGKVKRLIAWDFDRMHRHPSEWQPFIDAINAAKVSTATVQAGEFDLSTSDGRMMFRMRGVMTARESEHKSERVKSKIAELRAAGKWLGGPRPFGWGSDGVTPYHVKNKEGLTEIDLLREAKDRILAGESLHAVCADWLARGVRGIRKGDKVITTQTLTRILISPRMIGRNEVTKAEWAAIFSEDEWQQLRAILSGKRRSRPTRSYMLTGELLRCGVCGGPMYGQPTFGGRARPTYSCKKRMGSNGYQACGRIAIRVDFTDEMVMVRLVDHLNSKAFKSRLAKLKADNPGLGKAAQELEKVRTRQAELATAYGAGSVSMADWLAAKRALEPRAKAAEAGLEAAQAEVAGLAGLAEVAEGGNPDWSFGDKWREFDLEARRRAVLALVERVTIQPHQGAYQHADPDRVEVTFRA